MAVLSLLVTDIVGSTQLWAEHEQEMAADLAAHDALVRRVVSAHGGSVFKHTGDGAMAAFDDPLDAVEAAGDLQTSDCGRTLGEPAWHRGSYRGAQDRLVERGLIEQVRDAHPAWACDLATWIGSAEGTAGSGLAMRRYGAELDNLRLAVAHAVSSGQPEWAVTVVGGAWNMMTFRPTHEVVGWFDPLALPVEWSVERALAVGLHAYLRFLNDDVGALAEATRLVPATLHDVAAMITCRWTDLLWVQADLDGARAVLDTASTEHVGHSRVLDTSRVFTDLAAMLSGNLDPDFVAQAQRDAAALSTTRGASVTSSL